MIPWYWVVVALSAGVIFGMFVIALLTAARHEEDQSNKWWEK